MKKNGFSLIESLISLSIFLVVVLASLEFFGYTRRLFLELKRKEETRLAALAALDRMKADLLIGGLGLLEPVRLGILEGIGKDEGRLIILSKDKELPLPDDLVQGQTRILLGPTKEIKKGREVCIFDSDKGEMKSISSVYPESIILSSPLNASYAKEKATLILLKKISLYLDKNREVLRRKVNSSPGQPLLEETSGFKFNQDTFSCLVRLSLHLKVNKERGYETSVFPKNAALGAAH